MEHALSKIKWDVLGVSEVRRNYENITNRNSGILFMHGAAKNSQYGVGFCVKKEWKNQILEFKPRSERIATLLIRINNQETLKLIQVHAPTSEAPVEEILRFYEHLNDILEEQPKNSTHEMLIGDLNAKIGQRHPGEESIMGTSNYGIRNERGDMLLQFALESKLKIINSFFIKEENRKLTWKSPSGYKNEIDFALAKNIQSISNIEVINNLEFESDHRLIRVTLNTNKTNSRKNSYKRFPKGTSIRNQEIIYKTKLINNINKIPDNHQ